jgi:hypothetical protein
MAKTVVDLSDTIASWREKTNEISTHVGDLSTLNTAEDSDLVGAVNELKGLIDNTDSDVTATNTIIGSLAALTTTEDSDIVGAINELDRRLVNVYDDSDNLLNT